MANNDYIGKLKDPRWQKKRLEILNRDKWACTRCKNTEETLVVHHMVYFDNLQPWEYPDDLLLTFCESCHELELLNMRTVEKDLINEIKSKFLAYGMHELKGGFINLKLQGKKDFIAEVYSWALATPKIQRYLINEYRKYYKRKQTKFKKILLKTHNKRKQ